MIKVGQSGKRGGGIGLPLVFILQTVCVCPARQGNPLFFRFLNDQSFVLCVNCKYEYNIKKCKKSSTNKVFLVFLRNVHRVKYLRLTMIVAISVAMLVPTGIFAECCCSSGDAGCCTVTTPVEVSKTSCCSCEKALAESDSLLECATLKLGNRVRSSCECCRGIGQISTALPVRLGKSVAAFQLSWNRQSLVDGDLQQSSTQCTESSLPSISHNKRQSLLCVWIQ